MPSSSIRAGRGERSRFFKEDLAMIRALLIKELRELLVIAALGLAANLALVSNLTGWKVFTWAPGLPDAQEQIPFVNGDFGSRFAIILAACAVALALRQTLWESRHGTFLFLLHRPMARRQIFLTKLA